MTHREKLAQDLAAVGRELQEAELQFVAARAVLFEYRHLNAPSLDSRDISYKLREKPLRLALDSAQTERDLVLERKSRLFREWLQLCEEELQASGAV